MIIRVQQDGLTAFVTACDLLGAHAQYGPAPGKLLAAPGPPYGYVQTPTAPHQAPYSPMAPHRETYVRGAHMSAIGWKPA